MKLNAEDGDTVNLSLRSCPKRRTKERSLQGRLQEHLRNRQRSVSAGLAENQRGMSLTAPADLTYWFPLPARLDSSNDGKRSNTRRKKSASTPLVDNVKTRTVPPEDLLFQVMLDLGCAAFRSHYRQRKLQAKRCSTWQMGSCWRVDHDVTGGNRQGDCPMKPYYAVFRDSPCRQTTKQADKL